MLRRSVALRVTKAGVTKPEILTMRKSPFGMQGRKLHSNLLSDHVLTQRTRREEALYRQRTLEERGKEDAEAREEAAKLKVETDATPEGQRSIEIRWIYVIGFFGYLTGHAVAHRIFEGEETRLPYDPVNGFLKDLEDKQKRDKIVDDDLKQRVLVRDAAALPASKRRALHDAQKAIIAGTA